jgi:hypothetical protein
MLYFYCIILLGLLIYKKIFILLAIAIFNFTYLSFLYNYELDSNIRNYIIFSILFTIFVFGKNAFVPLFIIYMYLFLLYLIYSIKISI